MFPPPGASLQGLYAFNNNPAGPQLTAHGTRYLSHPLDLFQIESNFERTTRPPKDRHMATFYPFPRLPFELRAMIWEATVEPRTVVVRLYFGPDDLETAPIRFISPTPVPATLQTCQEARNLGLYQKEFTELSQSCTHGEMRYVWLNLDIDMIDVPNDLFDFGVVRTKIQRLKIHPDWYSETWDGPVGYSETWDGPVGYEVRDLKDFVNVRELHVVVDSFEGMDYFFGDVCRYLPCPPENIFWVHSEDGQTLNTEEMVRVASDMKAAREEAWRQAQYAKARELRDYQRRCC